MGGTSDRPASRPMKVYLSHVADDGPLARRAAAALEGAGFEVWTGEEVFPGDNWAAKYAAALDGSEAMVPLLSPAGLASERVQSDLSFALGQPRYKNRLVPVFTRGADPRSERFPWILRRFPLVRVAEGDGGEAAAFKRVADLLNASGDDGADRDAG